MTDHLTASERSENMRRIRGRDSAPELTVRRLAHRLGYRFRLHRSGLPGRPDLVFPSRHKVIFVHGCFWHRHVGCRYAYTPKSNVEFWLSKFAANVARDERVNGQLVGSGWDVLVLWECETRDANLIANRLRAFLGAKCAEKSYPAKELTRSKPR